MPNRQNHIRMSHTGVDARATNICGKTLVSKTGPFDSPGQVWGASQPRGLDSRRRMVSNGGEASVLGDRVRVAVIGGICSIRRPVNQDACEDDGTGGGTEKGAREGNGMPDEIERHGGSGSRRNN